MWLNTQTFHFQPLGDLGLDQDKLLFLKDKQPFRNRLDSLLLGNTVSLVYLSLNSVQQAMDRVAERVKQGGHDIPRSTIQRRYNRSRENFSQHYSSQVDDWAYYDNCGSVPVLIKRVPENAPR